ncbi:beta-1,4-galactosyltransferase 7-like isoform X1 [Homarus americanus]|uniref:beta-1,4-galactosyltransferase 7-like isoform X1 n=2 Tax=Homarus americanus TaxID=6706 RepID=UPI001C48E4C9|nr:beta-1,4-galactosyltransferase 7-like isoform X1 [Homarus americanus]
MTLYGEDDPNIRKCIRHGPVAHSRRNVYPPSANTPKISNNIKHLSFVWEMGSTIVTMLRLRRPTTLLWGFGLCLLLLFYVTVPSTNTDQCDCRGHQRAVTSSAFIGQSQQEDIRSYPNDKHKMAILIPFRDRFEELLEFAPHIHNFLNTQHKNHHLYIINQVDGLRFNRASLLNVGFLESGIDCDYVAMHDVDLLPMNAALTYQYPHDGPYHVAAPHLHPRYHYPTFIGGILLVKREHFRKVDGLSNKYWGWGLEDDEFFARLKEAKLEVFRPGNLTSGTKDTFKHIHDRRVRRRDMIKCYNQQEITRHRDRQTGLSTIRYRLQSKKEMTIQGAPMTILNVELECDRYVTPWCDCTENIGNTPKSQQSSPKSDDVIVPRLNRKKHLSHDG